MRSDIDVEELKDVLKYEENTGNLYWRERSSNRFTHPKYAMTWNKRFAGKLALTCPDRDGYKRGTVFGVMLKAHRVAWAMCHGDWPNGDIDHINGDVKDNRILNLRDVSRSINLKNTRIRKDNTSGVTGVCWAKKDKKWLARASINGKKKILGYFEEFDDAVEARKIAIKNQGYTERHGSHD